MRHPKLTQWRSNDKYKNKQHVSFKRRDEASPSTVLLVLAYIFLATAMTYTSEHNSTSKPDTWRPHWELLSSSLIQQSQKAFDRLNST